MLVLWNVAEWCLTAWSWLSAKRTCFRLPKTIGRQGRKKPLYGTVVFYPSPNFVGVLLFDLQISLADLSVIRKTEWWITYFWKLLCSMEFTDDFWLLTKAGNCCLFNWWLICTLLGKLTSLIMTMQKLQCWWFAFHFPGCVGFNFWLSAKPLEHWSSNCGVCDCKHGHLHIKVFNCSAVV